MAEPAKLQLVTTEPIFSAPLPEPAPAWTTGHDVQFYESESFLYSSVANFLIDGLRAGQPLVVIATEKHRQGFLEKLRPVYPDIDDRLEAHDIVWLDARDTLAAFMEGSSPNRELFEATVGNVLERLMAKRSYLVVRAYGEMVDLLWKDGNVEGAIALEELWNGLARKYAFNLLCAYSMGNFFKEAHTHSFRAICEHHGRVSPTEEYLAGDEPERLRQITLLQQRSRALEAEVKHRTELETALRETLGQRRRIEDELRRREAELRDFMENGLEAMHWVGPDGIVQWVNLAECQLLGYSREEMVGHHIAEFHADTATIGDILKRLSCGEELNNYQAYLRCKDGSVRHVLINSNVFKQDGRFIHTRCFTRDITFLGLPRKTKLA
jgi:PAS domain S-box-containing protein